MKRKFGSVVSAIALLAVAGGAAAVNVKLLRGNEAPTSVLSVQEAADVTTITEPTPSASATASAAPAAQPTATPEPTQAATAAAEPAVTAAPTADAITAPRPNKGPANGSGQGKMAIGSVGGGGGDGDGEDGEGGEHGEEGDHHKRGGFLMLNEAQRALLRVAALAQVSPAEARDAANGLGASSIIKRVKSAANQIGVPLADIAAVVNLPPERGRGHGGDDDHNEGDDDD